jgi:hypothetical protein
MNPAAVILGIAGSIITTIAMSTKQSGGGALRSFAPAAAPPDPSMRQLPPPRSSAFDSIPSHAVEIVPEIPSTAMHADAEQAAVRGPKDAARELLSYISPLIRSGNLDALGSKEAPNTIIQAMQTDMRKVNADGVYGPKTQARGKELLGVEFPARAGGKRIVPKAQPSAAASKPKPSAAKPAPAPPLPPAIAALKPAPPPPSLDVPVSEHSPKEAAEALWIYLQGPNPDRGHKGAPSEIVRAAQKDMAGGLKADGIYGPKTAARAKALTGHPFK